MECSINIGRGSHIGKLFISRISFQSLVLSIGVLYEYFRKITEYQIIKVVSGKHHVGKTDPSGYNTTEWKVLPEMAQQTKPE
ncbi:MAG TPA: hypothetical protein PKL65_07860 [Bacteroidales bacterium]|nr:hypothetical protein [Bacteroidales bacterium]HNR42129.1 hypothetical protein [Bacteroidales bacterium]HPM18715.1 hypothetical protein [Bacteroidales bacterium]